MNAVVLVDPRLLVVLEQTGAPLFRVTLYCCCGCCSCILRSVSPHYIYSTPATHYTPLASRDQRQLTERRPACVSSVRHWFVQWTPRARLSLVSSIGYLYLLTRLLAGVALQFGRQEEDVRLIMAGARVFYNGNCGSIVFPVS